MNPSPLPPQAAPIEDRAPARPFSSPLPGAASLHRQVNHRTAQTPVIYPLLLLTSTALAAAFCFLYISKPLLAPPLPPIIKAAAPAPAAAPVAAVAAPASLLPDAKHLPGDAPAVPTRQPESASLRRALPGGSTATAFEETNLRIQHVLTAEAPGGDVSRIVLDVPVLYQTGMLTWSPSEVAESRKLLKSLTDYQEKTRALRDEGAVLLAAWNRLVERSIPTPVLRADSPALSANQSASDGDPRPKALDTTESIQLQPAGK